MPIPFYIPPELAIKIGLALLSDKEKINNLLESLSKYLKTSFNIIVFGIASTGKTTMGRFIEGKLTFRDLSTTQRSINIEFFNFQESKNRKVNFIIMPGEERHEQTNISKLQETIAEKKTFGLINVVSYGYQFPKEMSHKNIIPEGKTLEDYLEKRREMEIESINKLLPYIKSANNLSWMITLVTKQDLWWDKRNRVKDHYQNGDYSRVVTKLQEYFGNQKPFIHEYISVSFTSLNVHSNDRKLIAGVVPGYDGVIQIAHWENFIDTMQELIKLTNRLDGMNTSK